MAKRFDFSEEEIRKIGEAFLCAIAAARDESTKLYYDLMDVCRTQNTLMAPAMQKICACHSDQLYELIRKRFQDWTESGASVSSWVRACGLGDDSFFAAYNLEALMLDYIDEQFCGVSDLDFPASDRVSASFLQARFAAEEVLRDYECHMEERRREQAAFFAARTEENSAYETVGKFVFEVFEIHQRTLPALVRLIEKVETRIEEAMEQAMAQAMESACTTEQAAARHTCAANFVID